MASGLTGFTSPAEIRHRMRIAAAAVVAVVAVALLLQANAAQSAVYCFLSFSLPFSFSLSLRQLWWLHATFSFCLVSFVACVRPQYGSTTHLSTMSCACSTHPCFHLNVWFHLSFLTNVLLQCPSPPLSSRASCTLLSLPRSSLSLTSSYSSCFLLSLLARTPLESFSLPGAPLAFFWRSPSFLSRSLSLLLPPFPFSSVLVLLTPPQLSPLSLASLAPPGLSPLTRSS